MLGPLTSVYWYQCWDNIPQFIGINARTTYLSLLVSMLGPHTSVYWYQCSGHIPQFTGINARTTYLTLLVHFLDHIPHFIGSILGPHTRVFCINARTTYLILQVLMLGPHTSVYRYQCWDNIPQFIGINARTTHLTLLVHFLDHIPHFIGSIL